MESTTHLVVSAAEAARRSGRAVRGSSVDLFTLVTVPGEVTLAVTPAVVLDRGVF